jgi:hypothetical protein
MRACAHRGAACALNGGNISGARRAHAMRGAANVRMAHRWRRRGASAAASRGGARDNGIGGARWRSGIALNAACSLRRMLALAHGGGIMLAISAANARGA